MLLKAIVQRELIAVKTRLRRSDDYITKGGQTIFLVRWSAAQRTTEILADQRQRTTKTELPLFRCSEFWPILKNI
jgi:hypothetical protein